MNKSKIGLIALLVVIIAVVVAIILVPDEKQGKKIATDTGVTSAKSSSTTNTSNTTVDTSNVVFEEDESWEELKVTELADGTLYSTTDETIKADIVLGDNYFDTQVADINLNFSEYEGKTIEIEGMYLLNPEGPFTFVGRYSTSNLCPDCPTGYSYMEYEWKAKGRPELKDEDTWVKVIGTLKLGDDNGVEYHYIDVASMEIMNEKGLLTVSN